MVKGEYATCRALDRGRQNEAGRRSAGRGGEAGWPLGGAYAPQSAAVPPDDFVEELNKNAKARAFFGTLTQRNTFPIYYRLQSAKKPETRRRRMEEILAMLARGEKFYP